MLQSVINSLFGCSHQRTTFPMTPSRRGFSHSSGIRNGTYVVCLDCGKEFAYNWDQMRVGEAVRTRATTEAQPMFR